MKNNDSFIKKNWKKKFEELDKLWNSRRHNNRTSPYDYFRQLVSTNKLKPRIRGRKL